MTHDQLTPAQIKRAHKALSNVPYAALLGIELESIAAGQATLAMRVRKSHKQNNDVVHGGAIASLIDSATAFAIITLLQPRERVTTVDLTINYMRPATKGKLTATAKVLRAGRRLFVVSADIYDRRQNLVATALSTYIRV